MEITHLGSASKNTQYCLSIGMDLYTKVSRVQDANDGQVHLRSR